MKTPTSTVLVSQYNRRNIKRLFRMPAIGQVHYLLKNWLEYPVETKVVRVELMVRERKDIRVNERLANLYELVCFSIKNPAIVLSCQIIEGYDADLERVGKEIDMPLTVPCCQFSGNKINVSLRRNDTSRADWCLVAIPYF